METPRVYASQCMIMDLSEPEHLFQNKDKTLPRTPLDLMSDSTIMTTSKVVTSPSIATSVSVSSSLVCSSIVVIFGEFFFDTFIHCFFNVSFILD